MPGGTVVTNPGTFDPIALTPDGQTIHGDHHLQDALTDRLDLAAWLNSVLVTELSS